MVNSIAIWGVLKSSLQKLVWGILKQKATKTDGAHEQDEKHNLFRCLRLHAVFKIPQKSPKTYMEMNFLSFSVLPISFSKYEIKKIKRRREEKGK